VSIFPFYSGYLCLAAPGNAVWSEATFRRRRRVEMEKAKINLGLPWQLSRTWGQEGLRGYLAGTTV
jgi:hypothetical protein